MGLKVRLADGKAYGEITGVYDYGAGEVFDITKLNSKVEMLPFKDEFLKLSDDKLHLILQIFEFTEATPE